MARKNLLGWGVTIITGIGNTLMKFCSVGDRLDLTPNTAHASVNLQAKNRVAVSRCKEKHQECGEFWLRPSNRCLAKDGPG